jgi:hypothetical protein
VLCVQFSSVAALKMKMHSIADVLARSALRVSIKDVVLAAMILFERSLRLWQFLVSMCSNTNSVAFYISCSLEYNSRILAALSNTIVVMGILEPT